MKFEEYTQCDGLKLAKLVATKELSAVELVETAINAIETLNPALNAVIFKMYDKALERAKTLRLDSPLAGVPFLIKDLDLNYQGTPTTWGSPFIGDDLVAKEDDELMVRYNNAGLITLGKTNSPEFGLLPTTEGGLFGSTKNPWNQGYSSGGSSGGASAAVASRMVPFAHANDIGGSIRIPASTCGLVGLKPSRGRMPYQQIIKQAHGMYTSHIISRSVRDTAAVLTHTCSPQLGAYYHLPNSVDDYLQDLANESTKLKIGFNCESHLNTNVSPDSIAAVMQAVGLCESLGHVVEEAKPVIEKEAFLSSFIDIILPNASYLLDELRQELQVTSSRRKLSAVLKAYDKVGNSYTAKQLLKAQEMQALIGKSMAVFHQEYDIYLTPTLGLPQFKLGLFDQNALEEFALNALVKILPSNWLLTLLLNDKKNQLALEIISFTILSNIAGTPSVTLPLHWNKEGLPIGCLFSANIGNEHTLLRLARQLEQACPWQERRPSLV